MWYLFFQVWVLLLVAFFVGWWAHWFFCCRNKHDESLELPSGKTTNTTSSEATTVTPINDDWKPQAFTSRPDQVDDLKRIKGIGAVIEKTLNEVGIYQFDQVKQWTEDNVNWVESFISFPGRIGREDWVSQAQTLATGATTDFANRVDKGEVDY